MADVAPETRAQLFLIAALTLAILFVSLALLLNTAIYTENLASRSTAPDAQASLEHRSETVGGIGAILTHANYHNQSSYAALSGALHSGVGNWSRLRAVHDARHGRSTSSSVVSTTNGTRITQQADSRNFTAGGSKEGNPDWQLATALHSRNVTMSANPTSLASSSAGSLLGGPAFFAAFTETSTGETYRVYVYNNSSTLEPNVAVETSSTVSNCEPSTGYDGGSLEVALSEATVDGTSCEPLEFFESLSGTTDVRYRNGDQITGNYSLVVDEPLSSVPDAPYDAAGSTSGPFKTRALYAATIDSVFVGPDVEYRTRNRVAPGEPDA